MSEYNIQMNKYNALNANYDQLYPQPMKHASTHAKDGNDSITPSMIGTYNKTEIDTALQNKAPAGYGLGATSKFLTSADDVNDIWQSGWYRYDSGDIPQNGITLSNLHVMRVDGYSSGVFVQTVYGLTDSTSYQICSVARRFRYDTKITPWEYENPPMILGKEYRTTERWKGKPVYTIAFDFGELPKASTKIKYAPVVKNVDEIIGCGGCGAGYSLPNFYPESSYNSFSIYDIKLSAGLSSNGGIACIIGTGKNFSPEKATVWVKYTKTTD